GADLDLGVVGALRVAPGCKILPFGGSAFGRDDGADAWDLRADVVDLRDELGSHEQHRCLAVLDDEGDFGTGEPPVHRRHHHIRLHRPHQQLEIDVAVLAEIGDALPRADTLRLQGIGDAVGPAVEFSKTGLASLEFVKNRVTQRLGAGADHIGKVRRLRKRGHVPPYLFLLGGVWRYRAPMTIPGYIRYR